MDLDLRRAIDQQEFFLVPPAQFVPLAECCGLIIPVGEWVLR